MYLSVATADPCCLGGGRLTPPGAAPTCDPATSKQPKHRAGVARHATAGGRAPFTAATGRRSDQSPTAPGARRHTGVASVRPLNGEVKVNGFRSG